MTVNTLSRELDDLARKMNSIKRNTPLEVHIERLTETTIGLLHVLKSIALAASKPKR